MILICLFFLIESNRNEFTVLFSLILPNFNEFSCYIFNLLTYKSFAISFKQHQLLILGDFEVSNIAQIHQLQARIDFHKVSHTIRMFSGHTDSSQNILGR